MNDETARRLIRLNEEFYQQMAAPFDRSRQVYQPGFAKTLPHLPETPVAVLDIGCGNGRYGLFLAENERLLTYTGIDLASGLLEKAAELLEPVADRVTLLQGDMAAADLLDGVGHFDLIVCLSALQHLPQRHRRLHLLSQMKNHLSAAGKILLGNWQFTRSERQMRKIRPWSEIDLSDAAVEAHDYLLTWQRGGFAYRYVCLIDERETAALAREAGLVIQAQFLADGKEGDLNLYTVLEEERREGFIADMIL
ncbi:MAG: class I SAM-dependent methyltransferase [Ardenticatenaceae bacterium]|nr:class I SAM-dependent methyltransferase [Ardenticatenaceae bacterium]